MLIQAASVFHPLLLQLDPESAHQATVFALKQMQRARAFAGCRLPKDDARLQVTTLGHTFPNPLGLAAGFDKQAEVADALLGLGFGFVEVGGVTPLPQAGNARPRVFRLPEDGAVINRYGLNSEGLEVVCARLQARQHLSGVVGVNMGANKDSSNRMTDYVTCMEKLAGLAAFATVNVSSPNTPGLRDLQGEQALSEILKRTLDVRDDALAKGKSRTSVLLKISPDLSLQGLDGVLDVALASGVDGVIIANTTISRPSTLHHANVKEEAGGLSGRPLFSLSTHMLAHAYQRVGKQLPLIGVGGIESGECAWRKMEAGASLIQLYTALIYQGPALIGRIKDYLLARLDAENLTSLESVVGRAAVDVVAEGAATH
jgi:dihydroorotate dehydrogenase